MARLDQDGAAYTLRLKSNPKLDKLAEHLPRIVRLRLASRGTREA